MGKIINCVFIGTIVILLIVNTNYRSTSRSLKENDIRQEFVIDSLRNANHVYDTLLSNILTDTNKINLNLTIKLANSKITNTVESEKKDKKGLFKWLKNK